MSDFETTWIAACQASLSITNSRTPPKLMSIESVMPSSLLLLCCPLLLLPPISPSIRVFSNESTLCMRWPKYWSFSLSISPSNEHPGLVSFRMDWLDLLAVQRTLKSLLQHHSLKASILWCSAFFTVQLLHPYMTTGKTIALTRWTFVGKVMSLLLNMLSRLVITFLPRSKCLLISWLQSPSAVILEPPKIKYDIVSTVSPSISHEVMGLDTIGTTKACLLYLEVTWCCVSRGRLLYSLKGPLPRMRLWAAPFTPPCMFWVKHTVHCVSEHTPALLVTQSNNIGVSACPTIAGLYHEVTGASQRKKFKFKKFSSISLIFKIVL